MIATASGRKRYKFRDYLSPKVLTMLALGFSSGIPFLLVGNTFGYWLADEHIKLAAIGFISWVGLAYSFQFAWSPLLDRVPLLKVLGQRRGWMLVPQILVAIGLFAMAYVGTSHGLVVLGACALLVAFSAATLDIAISAWRIESAGDADELGLLTSSYTVGFRIALVCTDSLILIVAQHSSWPIAYTICGVAMGVGVIATLVADEPRAGEAVIARNEAERPLFTPRGFFDAVAGPFLIFFKTHGTAALLMLLAISFYRVPDFVRGPMGNPFYHDLGLTKDVVGAVRGTVGLISTFIGVAVGGYLSLRFGYMRALFAGGVLQGLGIAAYALLSLAGPNVPLFTLIMCFDDFALGVAGVTLVAYMSSLTSLGYTATQYALLSSTYSWAGKILKGFSGWIVESLTPNFGLLNAYGLFYLGCGAIAVPSLALFWLLARHHRRGRALA